MDINPFAVELARVTLMIARKVAIDKHGLSEPALPLDTLDKNIVCQDALFSDWFDADAIIGNPPFLGGKRVRLSLGDEYIDRLFAKFSDVKDSIDFCAYWFRIAHDHLNENGRAGLVGTNSISQGKSRRASLDYIFENGGFIHDAISTQEWSGEAAVHVSIANWVKQQPNIYRLDNKEVSRINSSLQAEIDVTQAVRLKENLNISFQGVIPVGRGFYINQSQADEWIKANPKNREVLKLSCSAGDLTDNPNGLASRWIIDFNDMSFEDANNYKLPFTHIKTVVKPERDINRDVKAKENWWRFLRARPEMRKAISGLSLYFIVPRHSKWFVFLPAKSDWLPADSTTIIASDDFYILGILTSKVHRIWVKAQSSTLKGDTRYTHNTCFETFPFPQNKTSPLVDKIRAAMQELHQYRTEQMESKQWGITKLYNEYFHEPASQLYKLHAKLDKLVMQLYGFSDSDDLLEKLLHLNQAIAAQEKDSNQ
jgi:type II restriction/modification system DNA methylase subunit YeeA